MSKYGLDKALWNCIRDGAAAERLEHEPEAFADCYELADHERRALLAGDIRQLYEAGAIPFLIYQFAMHRTGGASREFITTYVGALQGLTPQDITT